MSKSRRSSSTAQFVEITLTEKQKQALEKDKEFKDSFWKALDLFTADNLKVTLKFDDYNSCGMVSVQQDDAVFGEPTTIWTLRSGSVSGALLKMTYFYAVLSDRTLPMSATRKEIDDDESLWG